MSLTVANAGLSLVPEAIGAARQRIQQMNSVTAEAIASNGQQLTQAAQRTISAAQTSSHALSVKVTV